MRGGMGNMQGMMKKMQKMQKEMEKNQNELNEREFTGTANDDLVTVTFTGDKKLKNVSIKEEIVDPEDVETLQDMTTQAINDALSQIDAATQKTMGAFANKLPF